MLSSSLKSASVFALAAASAAFAGSAAAPGCTEDPNGHGLLTTSMLHLYHLLRSSYIDGNRSFAVMQRFPQ